MSKYFHLKITSKCSIFHVKRRGGIYYNITITIRYNFTNITITLLNHYKIVEAL